MSLSQSSTELLHFITKPPRHPVLQLSIYFAVLVALSTVAAVYVPFIGQAIAGGQVPGTTASGDLVDLLAQQPQPAVRHLLFDLKMAITMIGALLITIPFSWGYMAIRERCGFEQSVVQTLILLPIVVAAIMMVVQSSLALAFALGGVAAAVRFRNTLKDVADATYVFLAIGIGIAAGTGALTAALVMSAIFTYVSVFLWRCNYGECHVIPEANGTLDAPTTTPDQGEKKPVRGVLTVDVRAATSREHVERVLARTAKRWELRHATAGDSGVTRLEYDIRLKRSASIQSVTAAVLGGSSGSVGPLQFVPSQEDAGE